MPKLLLARSNQAPETIGSFLAAAGERFKDAESLEAAGRRLGAVYLYGYAAEMLIKSAYFRVVRSASGLPIGTPITQADRKTACDEWQLLGLVAKPGPHDPRGWANLLVAKRTALGLSLGAALSDAVTSQAALVAARWRESLRYKTNLPYNHELRTIREASRWFSHIYPSI